ncbi:MAG: TIGR03960 family B12-binding radical SAM protein [Deltaproteobacteria bacterium]|nr:TIGR03960 family B12-binding radical SAM protein [Deltaproteobacteria bacterium]
MFDHPYAEFLARVERPGRYVGGEYGAVTPPDEVDLRIALAYPDVYEIGMSHIGLSVLYEIVNGIGGLSAERVFMPWNDLEAELRNRDLPLVSLEAARPLREFDVVGFSLQYELNYTNLLAMLELGRIPLRATERDDDAPLVIVGGPLAVQCEPLAPFIDLALVGDGEQELPALLDAVVRARREGADRKQTIDRCRGLGSVFAPGSLERVADRASGRLVVDSAAPVAERAIVDELGVQPPGRGPVPAIKAVFDRVSLEIARGCVEGCRFCQAGFLYRPVRERTVAQVRAAAERATSELGFDEVSLAALSSADHSRIEPLVSELGAELTPRRISLSVPSLRAYGLSDDLVEVLAQMRATGVTLAPEAGSQRLRDAINKNVTEDELMAAAVRFFDRGFKRIKLYFMIGLPGETDADLVEILRLAARLRDLGRSRMGGRPPAIIVSVSTFVPKPFTPFEREQMIDLDEIRRRQLLVIGAGRRAKIEVRVHDPRLSQLEGIFSRGDITLAPLLERAVVRGARFDGWGDKFDEDAWNGALEGFDRPRWLAALPDGSRVPWDHVDVGVDRGFLVDERDRARDAVTTQPCGRFASGDDPPELVCHVCGLGCDPDDLPLRSPRPPATDIEPPKQVRAGPRPRPLPPTAPDEGEPRAVRLTMAKWGRQAFVGHLDTIGQVMRCLRRAGLTLQYTRGFHPKPKAHSGPALPLGTVCLAEPIDVWLLDPPDEDELLERLRGTTPGDMELIGARFVADGEPKLSKAIEAAEYVALVRAERGAVETGLARLLGAERFEVTRTRKGKTKRVDVRPLVIEARVLDEQPTDLRVPPAPDRVPIAFKLEVPGSGGTRPSELLEACLGDPALDLWVVRTRVLLKKLTS